MHVTICCLDARLRAVPFCFAVGVGGPFLLAVNIMAPKLSKMAMKAPTPTRKLAGKSTTPKSAMKVLQKKPAMKEQPTAEAVEITRKDRRDFHSAVTDLECPTEALRYSYPS